MSAFDPTSIGAVAVADEFDPVSLGAVPVDAPAAVSAPLARMTDTAQGTFGGLPETVAKLPNWEEHPILDKARILGEHSRAFQDRIVNSNSLGSTIGGSLTAAAAMALAPESGGLSLLALGLAGATVGSEAGGQTQEALRRTDETPAESLARGEELARQAEKYPATTQLADMAVNLPVFRPSPSQILNTGRALGYLRLGATLPAAERQALTETLGAMGIGTGLAIGTHAASGEPLTVQDALIGGGQMAFLSKPTALGEALGFAHAPTVNPYAERAASSLEASGLPRAAEAMREAGNAPKAEEAVKPPKPPAEEAAPTPPRQSEQPTPEPSSNENPTPAEPAPAETPGAAPADAAAVDSGNGTDADAPERIPHGSPVAGGVDSGINGPTAIKNAQTALERARYGLPAATEPGPRTWEQARAEAAETIARDPEAPGRLVAELKATPRALNDTEDALLLHRQVQLQNEYDRLTTLTNQAIDAGDEGAVSELGERRNELLGHLQTLYDVDKSVGTVASRGFNARKMAMASDFTLTKMLADKRADKGADLSPPEIARVEDFQRQIADLQAQVAAHESGKVDAESHAAMDEALAKMVDRVQSERTSDEQLPGPVEQPSTTETQPVAPGEDSQVGGVPAVRVKAEEIASRPDLMQFKRMDDATTGINDADKLSGQWDDRKAGLLLLWEPANPAEHGLEPGQKYIVANGHHRLEFGERQGVKEFNAQVVREADGVSAQDARTLAAEINITDGKGTIYDQARFLRNYAAARGPDEAVAAGGRIGARGRKAASIAFSASDRLFDAFVNGAVSPDHAAAIAEAAPRNEAAQAAGLRAARSGKTPEYAANRAKAELIRPADAPKEFDLFGEEVFAEQDRQAEVATREQQRLSQELAAVRGAANRPELAAKHGVDVKDPEGVKRRIEALEAERERWKNWPAHPDLVAITREGQAATGDSEYTSVLRHTVETAKREILEHIASGAIPESVRSFSELHDHVDANEYVNDATRSDRRIGPLGKKLGWNTQGYVDFTNRAIAEIDAWLARGRTEEKPVASAPTPKVSKRAEKKSRVAQALDALQQKADEARARLEAKRQQPGAQSGPMDPTDLDDYAIIGANYFAKGATSFGRWAAKMVTDFGEAIRPHLQALWQRAKELHAQTVSPRDLNGERERIVRAVKERVEEGDSIADLGRLARGLAENYVRRGVTEREALVDAVHAEFAPAMPGLTRRQTMDAISGYGDFKPLSQEAVKVKLRELKGQMQQLGKLEDMANGLAPKKSGVERREVSDEERRLVKQVNEAKKKGGFEVTDPATQLRSAVGAIETRLANELKDLTEEFALGKKEGETRVPPTSDRIETLRGMIARVKESLRGVRESKGRSEEEQLAAATKATQRSLGEYERRLREDDFAPKGKGKAATSPELEALRAKRDAAKQEYLELRELDEGVAQRKEEARTRQLRDNIAELDRKLREGDTAPEAKPGPMLTSEQEALVSERDAMLRQLEEARRGPKKSEAEAQVERLLKSVNELDRRLREGDLDPKAKGAVTPLSPEAEHLMAIREAMQRELRAQQAAARPKKSDAELALQRWKTNALRQEADLRDRIARGDFAPKAKNPVKLDAEAQATKARLNQLTLDWRREREKARLAARPWPQRMLDAIAKWRRAFVLSGPVTLAKLTSSAFEIGTFTPGEDLVGGALGKLPVLSRVAAEAPRHGAFHWRAQAEAVGQTFTRLFSDVGHSIKTGHMDLDLLYGKPDIAPRELKDYIGAVHGALKAPARRNEFTRSFRMRIDWKASKGVDVTDPMIQLQTANEAYLDANRAIFSEDNLAVRAYRRLLSTLGEPDPITGQTPILAKAFQTGFKYVFPVVRIPTNIVARTFEYSLGTVSGGLRMTVAAMKGFDKLRPDEADLIMRNLKRGSVGLAVLLVGFFNPENVGGYYQAGRKREEDDVKTGGARIGGVNVPRYLIHNPLLEQLQIGATIRRVADSKLRKKDREEQGVSAGVLAAMLGLVEEVPFAREIKETAKAFTPRDRGEFVGRLASGVVPEGLRFTAEQMDKDAAGEVVKRKPESAADYVLQGIPGLRQNVRTKEEADKAAKRRR